MHRMLWIAVACALFVSTSHADEPKPAAKTQAEALPEGLRGFQGRIRGTIVSKDPEIGKVELKVTKVQRVWNRSKAKDPLSMAGRTVTVEGVFGKFLDVLVVLEPGESIDIGAQNFEGDKITFPGELLKKSDPNEDLGDPLAPIGAPVKPAAKPDVKPATEGGDAPKAEGPIPAGLAGFRGMLRGRVESKDAEKGKLTIKVDAIVKTWPKNKAAKPDEAVGKSVPIEGVFGKFLDVLIQVDVGDRVEVEAFHNGGGVLTFPGEWLKKVGNDE